MQVLERDTEILVEQLIKYTTMSIKPKRGNGDITFASARCEDKTSHSIQQQSKAGVSDF